MDVQLHKFDNIAATVDRAKPQGSIVASADSLLGIGGVGTPAGRSRTGVKYPPAEGFKPVASGWYCKACNTCHPTKTCVMLE